MFLNDAKYPFGNDFKKAIRRETAIYLVGKKISAPFAAIFKGCAELGSLPTGTKRFCARIVAKSTRP